MFRLTITWFPNPSQVLSFFFTISLLVVVYLLLLCRITDILSEGGTKKAKFSSKHYCCLSSQLKAGTTRQVSGRKTPLSAAQTWTNCHRSLPFVNSHFFIVELFVIFISMPSVGDLKASRAQLLMFLAKKTNPSYIYVTYILGLTFLRKMCMFFYRLCNTSS